MAPANQPIALAHAGLTQQQLDNALCPKTDADTPLFITTHVDARTVAQPRTDTAQAHDSETVWTVEEILQREA